MIKNTTHCPVCKRRTLPIAMKNHIINKAKGEVFNWMKENYGKNKKALPRISSNSPHFKFFINNFAY